MALFASLVANAAALFGESETRTNNKQGATLRIVDLISEGPIVGLADSERGNKSIFINGLPIEANDDSANYFGVKWQLLVGIEAQTAPSSFGTVESTHSVGREVNNTEPVIFRVSGRSIDAIRVALRFPAMFEQKDDGSTVGSSAQLKFEMKLASATDYVDAGTAYVRRKATSPFERNYRIDFGPLRVGNPNTIDENIDIRVTRLDTKSSNIRINNDSFVAAYISLSETPVAYSNSAVMAMEIDAEAFLNNPARRAFDVIGIRVQIPSNYDPVNHTYTSPIWDGSFRDELSWTDNPVWLLYAMLTNPRYGLGEVVRAEQINKWSFYDAARHNDEKVPNGEGGMEPRFTFNGVLNSRSGAYDVLNNIAGTFRSKLVWNTGMVSIVQDRPKTVKGIVSSSNVLEGVFSYAGSAGSARHTAAEVSWINPADSWKPNSEIVEDNKGVQRHGWRQLRIAGYGITSRAQARRLGLWVMQTEINETQVVSYAAGLDQISVGPGDIIVIADSSLNQSYDGGRILNVNNDVRTAIFDRTTDLLHVGTIVWITTTDSKNPVRYFILASQVSGTEWTIRGIDLDDNEDSPTGYKEFPADVWFNYVFDFGTGATWGTFDPAEKASPKLWRVLGTEEIAPGQVSVTALEYYAPKFEYIDALASVFETKETPEFVASVLSTAKVDATTIALLPYRYAVPGLTQELANISWETLDDPRILYYLVEFSTLRIDGDPEIDGDFSYVWESGPVVGNTFAIPNFEEATYYVRVGWVDDQGRRGPWSDVRNFEYNSELFTRTPPDVDNFKLVNSGSLFFTWDAPTSVDVLHYQIRHSVEDLGWEQATPIDGGTTITNTNFNTSFRARYFYIKAINLVGNESVNASGLRNDIRGIDGLDLAAEYFRPASTATPADNLEIATLLNLGAESSQQPGTIVSDWINTTKRWGRRRDFSYFLNRRLNVNPELPLFVEEEGPLPGTTDRVAIIAVYPRAPLRSKIPAYAYTLPGGFGSDRFTADSPALTRQAENGGVELFPSDDLESTNGETIGGFLYAEPFGVLANWDTLDFEESICVYKSSTGTIVGDQQARVAYREVYADNVIDMEIRRRVTSGFGASRGDTTYAVRDALQWGDGISLNETLALLVSKNTRPPELQNNFNRHLNAEPLDPEFSGAVQQQREFGNRDFESTQWYEASENLLRIGNKGYNKELRIWFPMIDFGAPVEFNFDAEIDWVAERADHLTDHMNRIPDRIDITNTDPLPSGTAQGDSGGTQFQLVNGITKELVPDFAATASNQTALEFLKQGSRLTLEMHSVDTSNLIAQRLSNSRRGRLIFELVPENNQDDRLGNSPRSGTSPGSGNIASSIFTTTGRHRATVVWPSVVITLPTGIYTHDCSLWRAVIRSLILRFDVQDRVESAPAIEFESGWLRIDYTPSFIHAPALFVEPVNLLANEQKEIRNQDNTGFEIRFTRSGSTVAKTFSYIARGFGYELTRTVDRSRG